MTAIDLNDVKLQRMLDNMFGGGHEDDLRVRLEQFRTSSMTNRLKSGRKLLPSLDVVTPEWLREQLEIRVGELKSKTADGVTARMLEQAFEGLEREIDRCFQSYGRDEFDEQDEACYGLEETLEILGERLETFLSGEEIKEADVELQEVFRQGAAREKGEEAGLPDNVVKFSRLKRL